MLTDAQIDAIWSEKPRSFYDHSRAIEQAVIEAGASGAAQDAAWQPMETRPINGSYIVANAKGQVAPLVDGVIQNGASSPSWDWHYGESVTHWRPLPKPPAAIDEAVEARQGKK